MTITSKAKKLIEDNKISLENFKTLKVVKEKDVLQFIKNLNSKSTKKKRQLDNFLQREQTLPCSYFFREQRNCRLIVIR